MKLTKQELIELLEKAKKTIPGPWAGDPLTVTIEIETLNGESRWTVGDDIVPDRCDADFISSFHPEVVRSLIEAVIGLSEALEFFTQNTTRNYSDPNETKAYTKAFEALEKWGVCENN